MSMSEALTILTHVTSQTIGRWLPPPLPRDFSSYEHTEVSKMLRERAHWHDISAADWEDLLIEDQTRTVPALPWLPVVMERRRSIMSEVSQATEVHLRNVAASGANILLISDSLYPDNLRIIAKPPLMLSCVGDLECLSLKRIAVIGSRQVSYFGLRQTVMLGERLARYPLCVVSGGAIGCDIAVHQGMLASGQDRIHACVVFAGGLAKLYPRRHEAAFDMIVQNGGLLISERLWWQGCLPHDFPIRNRIVSGMSDTVVVMQAGESSGALITADEALEQGREVMVLEHDEEDVRASGSRSLLADGALGFRDADEFIQMMGWSGDGSDIKVPTLNACHIDRNIGTVKGEQIILN